MTPEEAVALAILGQDEVPEPGTPAGDAFEAIAPYALLLTRRVAKHFGFVTAEQGRHVWLEHKGDPGARIGMPDRYEVGVPAPLSCLGCSGLFDGIGEYNP